ncbi:MAG: PD40 domain-containing protein [Cytophagales bacterium]|nr:PD40 domain-containing protein [Armatimonadota bacterium]
MIHYCLGGFSRTVVPLAAVTMTVACLGAHAPQALAAATKGQSAVPQAKSRMTAFLQWPDIHGDQIVFTGEGDLWLGSLSTGAAQRLTSHGGTESRAHFSPDGTRIAFSGQYESSQDVYVMPTTGGSPTRLTYDPSGARTVGWSPDGKSVLFTSYRGGTQQISRLYSVAAAGGAAKRLPIPEVTQAATHADGKRIAYVPVSADWQHWYRYKGGMADHLWLADTQAKTFKRLGDFDGIDKNPVWVGDTLYFISQRSGVPNVWKMDPANGKATEVTRYRLASYSRENSSAASFTDYEIDRLSTDGKRLIFQHGNGLAVYDPAANKTTEARFDLRSDRIHARPRRVPLQAAMTGATLGPSGKRLLLEARGQIVSVPVKEGDSRLVAPLAGSRSQNAAWSPDGKQIAFVSDRSGEEQVWIAPAQGDGVAKPLTTTLKGQLRRLEWSPDGKRIVVGDREMRILLIEVATGAITQVDQADRGYTYGTSNDYYHFSPDGKWLAYSKIEPNWNYGIYLYDITTKQKTRLTPSDLSAYAPRFDTSGKYLVYLSDREFRPAISGASHYFVFDKTTRVTLLALSKETKSPYLLTNDEEGAAAIAAAAKAGEPEAKKEMAAKSGTKPAATSAAGPPKLPEVKIDLEGLAERIVRVPLPAGNYASVAMVNGERLFLRDLIEPGSLRSEGPTRSRLLAFRVRKPVGDKPEEVQTLLEGPLDFEVSTDGKKMLLLSEKTLTVVDTDTGPLTAATGKVSLTGQTLLVDPEAEWRQIYQESWRIARDFFYDPALHGVNWNAVRAKYAALLPAVADRADLNLLLGDLIAELNVGHAYVGGGDRGEGLPRPIPLGFLGADLVLATEGSAYRIERIFPGDGFDEENRSPLLEPGVNVRAGDYILAVGGQPVRADQDIEALLVGTPGQIITLTVNRKPTREGARSVQVRPIADESQLRYYGWVADRQAYVAKNGGPNLGYVHIPDMGAGGLTEFAKHYYPNLGKDGLIYDVRYNGGGFIDAMLLLQMSGKPYSYFKPRYGASWTRQDWAFAGHGVALCNEYSGSDAEEFSDAFQRLKLGPVIGMRTWGGEVGSGGGYRLIDGGSLNIPNYGEWTPDSGWVIEGTGVTPDITVEQDPGAVLAGRDPQLDRAIANLKEQIAKNPVPRPVPPPFPNKAYTAAPEGNDPVAGAAAARRKTSR